MTNPSPVRMSIGEMASAIGVMAALSYCATIVFDLGYYTVLQGSPAPVTIGDITLGASAWLLPGVITLALSMSLGLRGGAAGPTRRAFDLELVFLYFAASILVAGMFYMRGFHFTVAIVVVALVSLLGADAWRHIERGTATIRHFARVVVIALLLLGSLGAFKATIDTTEQRALVRVNLNGAVSEAWLVRKLERGVLYLDDGHVAFAPWDSVVGTQNRRRVVVMPMPQRCFWNCPAKHARGATASRVH